MGLWGKGWEAEIHHTWQVMVPSPQSLGEPEGTRRSRFVLGWGFHMQTPPLTEQTGRLDKKHIGHIYWCMCFLQKCWKEEPALCPACWPAGRPGAGAQRLPVLREAAGECRGAAGQPQARSPLQPGPCSAGPRRVAEPAGWITPWRWQRASPPRWCRSRQW